MLRVIGALRQKTDYSRWAEPRNIYASWESRTRRAAELVPNNSRVIEFGAAKRVLERCLDPSCTYVPSDLNQRPLPDLGANTYDVAVLMGVLEYVADMPSVLDWLAKQVPVCIVSYACAPPARSLRGMRGTVGRLHKGWMNNYREEKFRSLFRERGFLSLHEEAWENQRMFVFSQRPSLA
jgi:hypothetical protein